MHSARKAAIFWGLQLALLSSLKPLSSSPGEIYQLTKETAARVDETQDYPNLFKIGPYEMKAPKSRICRRTLHGCNPFRNSEGAQNFERTREIPSIDIYQASPIPSDTENSFHPLVLKGYKFRDKMLFKSRIVSDEWNLEYARCEMAIANAIYRLPYDKDFRTLADILVEMAIMRKRMTAYFGRFNEEITHRLSHWYLADKEIDLNNHLKVIFGMVGPTRMVNHLNGPKTVILNKLFQVELQDKTRPVAIEGLVTQLEKLNSGNVRPLAASIMAVGLHRLALPPAHPSIAALGRLKPAGPSTFRTQLKWMSYQIRAEKDHYQYLRSLGDELRILQEARDMIPQKWRVLWKGLTRWEHEASAANRGSWGDGEYRPEKFTLSDYYHLRSLEGDRAFLVNSAITALMRIESDREDALVLQRQHMQTLVIESISELFSGRIMQALQNLKDRGNLFAPRYLEAAQEFQKHWIEPPSDFSSLHSLRSYDFTQPSLHPHDGLVSQHPVLSPSESANHDFYPEDLDRVSPRR